MRISRKYLFVYITIIVITAIAIVTVWQFRPSKLYDATANEGIIQIQSFNISSDSVEQKTSAEGTLFVKGKEGMAIEIQVVARIEVDSDDWGGVAFYIPHGWHTTSLKSSFPEKLGFVPANYTATWTTANADSPWRSMIEIARDRTYKPVGGGKGAVMIDIVPDGKANSQLTSFILGVEIGSAEKDGSKIMGQIP